MLIANGYAEGGARAVEAAAKATFNVQTLPAQSVALVVGALDAAGDYRATQLAIYENNEYVGAIALTYNGLYGEGAEPTIPAGLLNDRTRRPMPPSASTSPTASIARDCATGCRNQ